MTNVPIGQGGAPVDLNQPPPGVTQAAFATISESIRKAVNDLADDSSARTWIELCASVVFVASALLILLLLFLGLFSLFFSPLSAALAVRIAQIGLTVMAVSITTALICRFQSVWSLTFGLVIIGALIVPSNEIVRFILLLTGSDRTYTDFYENDSPKRIRIDFSSGDNDPKNRCKEALLDDVIVYRIPQRLSDESLISPSELTSGKIQAIVSEEVIFYAARESIANVVAMGASDTLRAVAGSTAAPFQTAFQNQRDLSRHMLYLRSEGLVEFPFDQMQHARLTAFGRLAFENIATDSERDAQATQDESIDADCPGAFAAVQFSGISVSPPPPFSEIAEVVELGDFDLRPIGESTSWVKFTVPVAADYSLLVLPPEGREGDPTVAIFNERRERMAADDDGGDAARELASYLTTYLPAGTYALGVRDLDMSGALFRVALNSPPVALQPAPSPADAAEPSEPGPEAETEPSEDAAEPPSPSPADTTEPPSP